MDQPPEEQEPWRPDRAFYPFIVDRHSQQNVFEGSSSHTFFWSQDDATLVRPNRSHELSIMHFKDNVECQNYHDRERERSSPNAYMPMFVMDTSTGKLAIGNSVGVPLLKWMCNENVEIWEYSTTGAIRAGKDWRLVGRWLGVGLSRIHNSDDYVGNLLQSTYVDEKAKQVWFVRGERNMDPANGIREDLVAFVELVDLMIANKSPLNSSVPMDVVMFMKLANEFRNSRGDLSDMKVFSYFLCHNPLYWDFRQRFSFFDSYYHLRNCNYKNFDNDVSFQAEFSIQDSWKQRILSSEYKTLKTLVVYFDSESEKGYQHRWSIMAFHRSSIVHTIDKGQDPEKVDEMLFRVYPEAAPIAFYAFFKSGAYDLACKISILKGGRPGLNYVRQT